MNVLTLGCDPEIFLEAGGQLLPAFDFLPSKLSKEKVFWDGVQAEFTVKPGDVNDVLVDIRKGLLELRTKARKFLPGADFLLKDCYWLKKSFLASLRDDHVALGCDASLNMYGSHSFIPSNPRDLTLRFAGGHLHFGSDHLRQWAVDSRPFKTNGLIYALDNILGLWSVGLETPVESVRQRRTFYGMAGEARMPEHGVEYRTLSNFWLGDPRLAYLTLSMAKAVYIGYTMGETAALFFDEAVIKDCINTYNVEDSRKFWSHNLKPMMMMLKRTLRATEVEAVIQMGLQGVSSLIKKSDAVSANWGLDKGEEEGNCLLDWATKPTF